MGDMSLSELHTERVDADQLVAAIIDSMSDRDEEVTPDAPSDQAQPRVDAARTPAAPRTVYGREHSRRY